MAHDWPFVPLGQLVDPKRGISYGIVQPGEHVADGVPIIRAGDLRGDRINAGSPLRVSKDVEASYSRTRLSGGELVMSIVGTVGQTAIVDERFVGWNTARAVAVIPVRADIGAHWIRLALKTPKVQAQINSRLNTTVQATLNLRDVSQLPIALPPLRERRAVASVLAPLDDKIELNRRMNETLEAMAGAIFKDWFVDFGPTRAKEEGRAPYLAADAWSLFPDRLDYEGKPEGWAKRPIGDFAELRGGKQLEKERITTNGKIPVFGGAGLMGFTDEHNADGFVISVGRVGAYCGKFFSRRGKAWINNNASLIRPFDRISGEWLFLSLQNADIEVIKKGAAQPFVSNTDVANMPVIWPGEIIMRRFAEVAVPLILKVEQNEAETSALAGTRDFLLPKLMSGEVHVKDAERIIGEAT